MTSPRIPRRNNSTPQRGSPQSTPMSNKDKSLQQSIALFSQARPGAIIGSKGAAFNAPSADMFTNTLGFGFTGVGN